MIIFLFCFVIFTLWYAALAITSFTRLSRFSAMMDDEINFKHRPFVEYVKRTKRTFIPIDPNRRPLNMNISESYNNLNMWEFWNWDFKSMIVEEK